MSDRDEREDYMVQQQAREVWIESYSQGDRILLQRGERAKRKEGRRVPSDPNQADPNRAQTTPTAVSPERKASCTT